MRAAWNGLCDGTRAIGVTPAVSAATQIVAAVSSEVALCSRSMKMASKPQRAAIIGASVLRIWLTAMHSTSSPWRSFFFAEFS